MIVMKFGGTSVADCQAITRTISIIRGKLPQRPVVVVSALSKVTDLLYRIADQAAVRNRMETSELLDQLRSRHIGLAHDLMSDSPSFCHQACAKVNDICDSLSSFVGAVCSLKVPGIVSAAYEGNDAVITQGFVSATAEGEPTVLGRGGSDYSASLIGMAIDASAIEIWTDVDGVRTADPRKVENTKCIERISFEEAAEMAHFGAKVLHPLTIEPAVNKNIPIYVLNSMNPEGKGTVILQSNMIDDGVKSVSFKENILVINIFSTKMINTSGFLKKVFEIFSVNKVSVDLISTSEANISVTVDSSQKIDRVVEELSGFADVYVDRDKSQISVIGKNITNLKGLLQKTFAPLSDCKIYMISQGASYVNLSFVVDRNNMTDAVRQIHKYLFENESCN